jgi:hypothetical protein
MADPKSLEEYNELISKRTRVSGFGMDTMQHMPCPFCAVEDHVSYKILEMEEVISKPIKCESCGRTSKVIFHRDGPSVSLEIVQTDGPDLPEWFGTLVRRVQ